MALSCVLAPLHAPAERMRALVQVQQRNQSSHVEQGNSARELLLKVCRNDELVHAVLGFLISTMLESLRGL